MHYFAHEKMKQAPLYKLFSTKHMMCCWMQRCC